MESGGLNWIGLAALCFLFFCPPPANCSYLRLVVKGVLAVSEGKRDPLIGQERLPNGGTPQNDRPSVGSGRTGYRRIVPLMAAVRTCTHDVSGLEAHRHSPGLTSGVKTTDLVLQCARNQRLTLRFQ